MLIYILLVFVLCISATVLFSNLPLTVRREKLGGDIRIVQVSDIHKRRFGRGNSRLIGKISAEKPDLIFITGDFVSRYETDFTLAISTLKSLCTIAPVYMIMGNHEQSLQPGEKDRFLDGVSGTEAVLLRNTSVETEVKGRKIKIYGLEENYGTYKKNGGYKDLDVINKDDMTSLLGECNGKDSILLAHNPLFAEAYEEWGAGYIFSGHIHGGAVRLFGVGMLSPERKFFPRYSKGIYKVGRSKMLVSAGLGKLRLFVPPEIVIYEI